MSSESLGRKIAKLRKQNNLTQEQLANKLNVTDGTVSKWETDKSRPDYEFLKDICKIFNVKTSYLLDDLSFREKIIIKLIDLIEFIKKHWLVITLILINIFLLFYFVNTLFSFQMYGLVIEDNSIMIESGYYTKTKNVISLDINNIKILLDDKDVIDRKIKLYTFNDNQKLYFYESSNLENISINDFKDYEEYMSNQIAKSIPKSLYLEISDLHKNDKYSSKIVKVTFVTVYDSKWFYNKYKVIKNKSNKNIIESEIKIDGNQLDNLGFTRIKDSNTYYKQMKDYKLYVDLDDEKIFYTKYINNNYKETIEYFYNTSIFCYKKTSSNIKNNKEKTITEFIYKYRLKKIICETGNCNNHEKIYNQAVNNFQQSFGLFSES